MGSLSLLQGIFPTQGLNPDILHCRWILYQLSHKGSPRILEWVAYPFSRSLPNPGIKPGLPALQADALLSEPRETWIQFLGGEDLLEKKMATHSSYSCLENLMDGGAWWAAVHGVAKSQTQLSDFTFTFITEVIKLELGL